MDIIDYKGLTIVSKDGAQYTLSGGWSGGSATDGDQVLSLSEGTQVVVDGVNIKVRCILGQAACVTL